MNNSPALVAKHSEVVALSKKIPGLSIIIRVKFIQ